MNIKDIFNWVKGFFVEVKIETYAKPTEPVKPEAWPFPVVVGDHCPKEGCKKKPAKKKPIVKDKAIKSMRKTPAPKNETAKKAAVKRARKAK